MAKPPSLRFPSARHFAAIGRFVYGCSVIEASLADLLRVATGIKDEEVARAVIGIGDLRVVDYVVIIKRVTAISGFDAKNLTRLLHWVTYFNDVRKVVAHKPCFSQGDTIRFSNHHTAKSRNQVWVYHCTIGQLRKAAGLMSEVQIGITTVEMQMRGMDFDFSRIEIPDGSPDAALLQRLGLPDRPADTRRTNQQ